MCIGKVIWGVGVVCISRYVRYIWVRWKGQPLGISRGGGGGHINKFVRHGLELRGEVMLFL